MNWYALWLAILGLTAIAATYVAIAKHDRIRQLERQLSDATWRHLRERQRANVLHASITRHLAAKDTLLAEVAYMQSRCCHMTVRAWRRRERVYRTLAWKVRGTG